MIIGELVQDEVRALAALTWREIQRRTGSRTLKAVAHTGLSISWRPILDEIREAG